MTRYVIYLTFHGNLAEWTTECCHWAEHFCVRRGAGGSSGWDEWTAYREGDINSQGGSATGFRPGIWIIN